MFSNVLKPSDSIGEIENKESYDKDRPVLVTPGTYEAVMVDCVIDAHLLDTSFSC